MKGHPVSHQPVWAGEWQCCWLTHLVEDMSLAGWTLSKEPVSFLAGCWDWELLDVLVNWLICKISGGNTTVFLANRYSGADF